MLLTVHLKIKFTSMINEDIKLQVLYDHYKDALLSIKETNKTRDRLLVFAILLVGALFFQIVSPENSSNIMATFLSQKTGLVIGSNADVIGGIIWFSLFVVVLRYFQLVVSSERQYPYLHEIEEKLNILCQDKNFISCEGKSYLKKYPWFSDWIHWIYRAIFPLILFASILIKIIGEWQCANKFSVSLLFDSVVFIFIVITTALYLCYIYFKR